MAFVILDSWSAEAGPRLQAGPVSGALGGLSPSMRRIASGLFTAIVHFLLLYLLIARLAGEPAADPAAPQSTLSLYDLSDPGSLSSASKPAPVPAAPPSPPTVLELSAPADLPPLEWSVSSMRVARADSAQAPAAGAGAASSGTGRSGGPRLSEFVGFGDGIGGELLLNEPMLEAARLAAVGAVPGSRGTALVFLRVAPSGIVTEAVIRGGGREMASALRRELLGKKLFLVRSRIRESALVALPPLNLSAAS